LPLKRRYIGYPGKRMIATEPCVFSAMEETSERGALARRCIQKERIETVPGKSAE
jgi:hypothetical protein